VKAFDFGAIMRAARVRAKLSQEELAARLNYNQSDISKIEGGHKEPTASILFRWFQETNAMEVAVAYFCGMDGLQIMQSILGMVGAA